MTTGGPDYQVTLRPLADRVPAPIRLKRFLKMALRGYGLRCVGGAEIQVAPGQPREQETQRSHKI